MEAVHAAGKRTTFFLLPLVMFVGGTKSTLCEDGFLESGINENQQSRTLRFESFKKFEAVTGAQPQRSQQQVRLQLLDLVARITNVVSFTADNHVLLGIQKIGNTVPKQRVLFQNDNSCFYRLF